jgi:N-acetyl-anhydromuramyl-L-alanine amidase AmpD
MSLPATHVAPNKQDLSVQNKTLLAPQTVSGGAECPSTLNCRFIPAGYAQNSADPTDYGNYDNANRPHDMAIKYIVIHDTEGSYDSAINHFQDTTSYVSGNYIIRSSDGAITQMVHNQDVSWGARDWYVNMHAINIEHEGYAAQASTWYTEAMYKSSATLVRYLANTYHIPLDREHIIGHDNAPTISPARMPGQHWDPGPFWDWNHYMALLHGVSDQTERLIDAHSSTGAQKTVTINPALGTNQQLFSDCQTGTCVNLPTQGSSTVFVRTQPTITAPLVSDQYVHSDGSAGTNRDNDWGDQATYGQQFAWAGQQGDWIAIWYNGQKGWIHNPSNAPVASVTRAHTVTPRAGQASIPIYGAAYPEASAYPADGTVPVQTLQPLYAMPTGQAYTTTGEALPTDYFYDWTVNYSAPHDHMVVVGNQKYYQITYNHRVAFVRASDVRFQY